MAYGTDDKTDSGSKFESYVSKAFSKIGEPLDLCSDVEHQLRIGDTFQGHEIKHDRRSKDTGHLAIEVAVQREGSRKTAEQMRLHLKNHWHGVNASIEEALHGYRWSPSGPFKRAVRSYIIGRMEDGVIWEFDPGTLQGLVYRDAESRTGRFVTSCDANVVNYLLPIDPALKHSERTIRVSETGDVNTQPNKWLK